MANAESVNRSHNHLKHFKWLYVLSSLILLAAFICLIFLEKDPEGYWADVFTFLRSSESVFNPTEMNTHGVFGFYLSEYGYFFRPELGDYTSPRNLASAFMILLLIALVLMFAIPKKCKTQSLISTQNPPLRARVSVAIIFGLFATAFLAGTNDIFGIPFLEPIRLYMWFQVGSTESVQDFRYAGGFTPDYGIAQPITWLSVITGIVVFGTICMKFYGLIRMDLDRYWQSVRCSTIFCCLGLLLILMGFWGIRPDDRWSYYEIKHFAGGSYTAFVIGFLILTWGTTSRTVLLVMAKRYERAKDESETVLCSECGYDLRMLSTDNCPECGALVKPVQIAKIKALKIHAESRSTTR